MLFGYKIKIEKVQKSKDIAKERLKNTLARDRIDIKAQDLMKITQKIESLMYETFNLNKKHISVTLENQDNSILLRTDMLLEKKDRKKKKEKK